MVMEDSCVVLLLSAAAGSSLLHTALKGTSLFNSEVYFQTILLFCIGKKIPIQAHWKLFEESIFGFKKANQPNFFPPK